MAKCDHSTRDPWIVKASAEGDSLYIRVMCPVCTKTGDIRVDLVSLIDSAIIDWGDD